MKKLGSLPIGLSFAGCFLGVGCMSGAEVFQFFGTFGIPGFVGVFFAVTGLALAESGHCLYRRENGRCRY